MAFKYYTYHRPDLNNSSKALAKITQDFIEAETLEIQNALIKDFDSINQEFSSMYNICMIRHSIDTQDSFYAAENDFFDQNAPEFEAQTNAFYKALSNSKFRPQLEEIWGKQLFTIVESSLLSFSKEIIDLLQKENELSTKYTKLKATAKIVFEEKEYNLSTIGPFKENKDRSIRKKANEATWAFYAAKKAEFESIFTGLVQTRTEMAKKLSFGSFTEMAYKRLTRSDYTPKMIAHFREAIRKHIVPLCQELYHRQAKRLELDKLAYWDEEFSFTSGNPKPKGDAKQIIAQARKMYSELSQETSVFFEHMEQEGLMDLISRDGKATGGYCTYIPNHKAPFIFSNFNGTSGDIDVLTHEAGHAFQVYSSQNQPISEFYWPTYEACEIHSMSMEFFAWPWMGLFFNGDEEKYKFSHLESAIKFLPYGCAVDEFQHAVYENPNWSAGEREQAWKEIEKKFLPHRSYGGIAALESGSLWIGQSHIYVSPFYYIDYVLAQICAFQFWQKDRQDHKASWKSYLNLCKQGGSQSFLDLVKIAGLKSPFEERTIQEVSEAVSDWLSNVDDLKF